MVDRQALSSAFENMNPNRIIAHPRTMILYDPYGSTLKVPWELPNNSRSAWLLNGFPSISKTTKLITAKDQLRHLSQSNASTHDV